MMISESKDYSMYEDDEDQAAVPTGKKEGLFIKKNNEAMMEVTISGQKIVMIDPGYVLKLQRQLAELESKIKRMGSELESLRDSVRRFGFERS